MIWSVSTLGRSSGATIPVCLVNLFILFVPFSDAFKLTDALFWRSLVTPYQLTDVLFWDRRRYLHSSPLRLAWVTCAGEDACGPEERVNTKGVTKGTGLFKFPFANVGEVSLDCCCRCHHWTNQCVRPPRPCVPQSFDYSSTRSAHRVAECPGSFLNTSNSQAHATQSRRH